MAEPSIRSVALAGLGEFGQKCLTAIAACDRLTLVGVADRDATLAEHTGRDLDVPYFSDQRQLLTQTQPELVIAAAPSQVSVDLAMQAARLGIHAAKPGPLGRSLDEAVDLVNAFSQAERRLTVLSPRRWQESYRCLWTRREPLGSLFLARAQYIFNWGRRFDWRADQTTAGGGVLLEAGYEMIDLLLMTMGLPEAVYAVTGRRGRPHMIDDGEQVQNLGIYDTDDTATVVLRYPSGASAALAASWVSSPAAEGVIVHGQKGTAQAEPAQCIYRDADGQVIDRVSGDDRHAVALTEQLTALAETLDNPVPAGGEALHQHLLTMATVEAAYLSDRTGQPESPHHLLRAREINPDAWPGAGELTGQPIEPLPEGPA